MGAVRANYGFGIDECPGQAGADEGQDHEADVGAVGYIAG